MRRVEGRRPEARELLAGYFGRLLRGALCGDDGPSRGGLSTKLRLAVDAAGGPCYGYPGDSTCTRLLKMVTTSRSARAQAAFHGGKVRPLRYFFGPPLARHRLSAIAGLHPRAQQCTESREGKRRSAGVAKPLTGARGAPVQDAPANDVPSSEFQPMVVRTSIESGMRTRRYRCRPASPNVFAADSHDGATAAADTPAGLKFLS
jgi:hypothetical protein